MDWKRVSERDDSRFRLLKVNGKKRICRQADETMDPIFYVGIVQVMVAQSWSEVFFRGHGLGSLVCAPTYLNAIWYVEVLGDHLYPLMQFCYLHGSSVFQPDNCTSPKCRLVTGLNSVENLWHVLEQGVKYHHTVPKNFTELGTALVNI
ncbi:transposable element Tcb2 transposase [Trichonephila clavipes]|nr:transposable element Tcb2 transposase [Trichonephila clavipes]